MFDRDKWIEILSSMLKNPLRTILTSISVSVGIFILIVLMGLGYGFQNGVKTSFADDVMNTIWVRSGSTTIPYAGYQSNRRIQFQEEDHQYAKENVSNVAVSSSMLRFWSVPAVWKDQTSNFGLRAVHPEYIEVERLNITGGRFINQGDQAEVRKVAVIGTTILEEFFKDVNPIGEYIQLNGVQFLIIGSFDQPNNRWGNRQAYVPMQTGVVLFGKNQDKIDQFVVGTGESTFKESKVTVGEIDSHLKSKYSIHPKDSRAMRVRNMNEQAETFEKIFKAVDLFILALGFLTLLVGIIGVSNIMSIVVRERTKEIGVRKALGATPWSVVSLIIQEAFIMTLVSGLAGFAFGVFVLYQLSNFVDVEFFRNPQISLSLSIIAIGILVFTGVLAGLIPSLRAARIKPIEALKDE